MRNRLTPGGTAPGGAVPADALTPGRPAAPDTGGQGAPIPATGPAEACDGTAGNTPAHAIIGTPTADLGGVGRAGSGGASTKAPALWNGARGLLYLGVLSGAVALCALAAALYFGGALTPSVPWLDGSGGVTRGGLPVAELVMNAAGTVTVGLLLAASVLPAGPDGGLPPPARRCLRAVRVSAGVWTAANVLAGDWYASLARTWGPLPEHDQQAAGLLVWAAGGLATVTLPLLTRRKTEQLCSS